MAMITRISAGGQKMLPPGDAPDVSGNGLEVISDAAGRSV